MCLYPPDSSPFSMEFTSSGPHGGNLVSVPWEQAVLAADGVSVACPPFPSDACLFSGFLAQEL